MSDEGLRRTEALHDLLQGALQWIILLGVDVDEVAPVGDRVAADEVDDHGFWIAGHDFTEGEEVLLADGRTRYLTSAIVSGPRSYRRSAGTDGPPAARRHRTARAEPRPERNPTV